MKVKMDYKKISPYVIAITVAIIGIFIGDTINHNQNIAEGILGVAVIYYAFRFYFLPLRIDFEPANKPFEFKFPKNIGDLIAGLFLAISLSIAAQQLINTICWVIKALK